MADLGNIQLQYTENELKALNSGDSFMDAFVELHKNTVELLYVVIDNLYFENNEISKKLTRDEAIIGGNLVRLIKLNTSFLENICNGKLEISFIISRCLVETAINLQYMLIKGEEKVLRNYVKYSLITEKELWNTILENIKIRGGTIEGIEQRMKSSIQSSFDESDFELDEVNKSSKWKSIAKRAAQVADEKFYGVFYGIGSHVIHGNWQDLLLHHLNSVDGGYQLNLQWNSPKPQIVDSAIVFNLMVVKEVLNTSGIAEDKAFFEKVETLKKYFLALTNCHEDYLAQR